MKGAITTGGFAFLLSGCALFEPAPQEDPVQIRLAELDRRLQNIERIVENQGLAQLTQKVAELERRADQLQGRDEELEYESAETAERQRLLYADLDSRIQELERNLQSRGSASVLEGGTLPPGQLPVPEGTDRDNYQVAFELLKDCLLYTSPSPRDS